ncbi:MAG: DUF2147 domain-containing protein [Burkholderiales bacterium]|nr:DUF2147 domain-containing protein [Burkholderiales bacterium]
MGRGQVACRIAALAVALAAHASAAAQDAAGVWWTPRRDGKIAIAVDPAGVLTGRIIAGRAQSPPRLDERNPEPALRTRPLLGLSIITGFRPDAANPGQWADGRIYDPDNGKTYNARLWLDGPDRMMLRGYVGAPLFGRTETFTRVAGPAPHRQQAGEPAFVHLDPP